MKLWEGATLTTTESGETEAGLEPAAGIHEASDFQGALQTALHGAGLLSLLLKLTSL